MPSVDELFDRFRAAHRAGEDPDPRAYLAELRGRDRSELDALITGFLAAVPGRPYDPEAFAAFVAQPRVRETLARAQEVDWTTLLPEARDRAQIRRADLVSRLARALGAAGKEAKVGRYYHEMEVGARSARDVSGRVLEALSAIVQVPVERLREAGERLTPPGPAAVFARSASAPAPAAAAPPQAPEDWDEVDELFNRGESPG
jgi:hypothetical protein